jgi:glucose/arabinose dehydrogenase
MRLGRRTRLVLTATAVGLAAACFSPVPNPDPAAAPTLTWQQFVGGLNRPWDMGFLADGTMFFTERPGNIKVRLPNGNVNTLTGADLPFTGPDVQAVGEGGMMGLAVDPDFATNRFVYTCFSSTANDNRVARWTVNGSLTGFDARTDIVTGMPYNSTTFPGRHSGCRPRFQPGPPFLFVGTGDAATNGTPQDLGSLGGKVLRVTRNGGAVSGNMQGLVFSSGHRNVQGIAFQHATNVGMSVEHGPGVDDEVNRIFTGDFGWHPDVAACGGSYCENVPMTAPGAIPAVWSSGNVTPAPSGATFLSGPQWEGWNGALAVCMLGNAAAGERELRIMFPDAQGTIVATASALPFGNTRIRLRSAVQGPDGNLYVATDVAAPGGQILKVTPS